MGQPGNAVRLGFAQRCKLTKTVATITSQKTVAYSTDTTTGTPDMFPLTVNGCWRSAEKGARDGRSEGYTELATDQRTATRILEIPTLATDGTELSFTPQIGDAVTINEVEYSIRWTDAEIFDDVTVKLVLHLEQS